jgi:CheY-like chemotaxis protein
MGYSITGFLQINQHCTFPWTESEYSALRTLEIRSHHCAECIAELRRIADAESYRIYDQRGLPADQADRRTLCQCVLLIDDEDDILDSVALLLGGAGYEVVTAHDAAEGLAKLGTLEQRCLVLLDLDMPVLSGWDFLAVRSRHGEYTHLPVILITGREPHGAAQAATAYLKKPIDGYLLRKLVEQFCGPRAA